MKKFVLENLKIEDVFNVNGKKCVCGHEGCFKHYRSTNTWYCHSRKIGKNVIDLVGYQNNCDFKTSIDICCEKLRIDNKSKSQHSIRLNSEQLREIEIKKELCNTNRDRLNKFINYCLSELQKINLHEAKNKQEIAYKDVYNRFLENCIIQADLYKENKRENENFINVYIDCEVYLNSFVDNRKKLNEEYKQVLKYL